MSDYKARIAPFINVTFYVTSIFGEIRGKRVHKGIDIATPAPGNELYSMCDGVVIRNWFNEGGYGNALIIKSDDGRGFLFGHLRDKAIVSEGERVKKGQLIGHEGTTGSSTGIHLHLEMQDLANREWIFQAPLDNYLNPADFMGIPNVDGISAIYDGTTPPKPTKKIKKFKWAVFSNIIRNRRNNF